MMELLGSTFDDSMFLEERDRVSETLKSYNAKVCEPQWFCADTALDTDDSLEKQKVMKFRGDMAVRKGEHQKAFEAYRACLEWISESNLNIRRDVLEGMARCSIKMGQKDKALELVELLNKEASNTCHLTSLLLLKVSIYHNFGDVGAKILCLQQLCSLLPFNPWHWLDLGCTCLQLLGSDKTTGAESQSLNGCEVAKLQSSVEAPDFNDDTNWLKACICFIRSRLLLKILQQQQSSFVLKRSEKALEESDRALQHLNPTETTIQRLTEVMLEDLIPEKMKEDYQDGESLMSVHVQSFRQRWWDRVLQLAVTQTQTNTNS
uniref:Zgc:101716 n=1 Tax=Neogobius melanostomus TaxID=47308 RepID=A0A8C6SLT6_9GOBI